MAIAQAKQKPSKDLSEINMASSVTRHVLIPEEENFEFLLSGVDSLDLGLYIYWQDEKFSPLLGLLQDYKEKSQNQKGLMDRMPDGRSFLHLPTGKPPNYRFHLQFADYHLYLGITNPPANSPNSYLSLNSKALWHKGINKPVDQLKEDIEFLGGDVGLIQPSRCDLCADFYLPGDPTLEFIKEHMVSRVRKISHFGDRDILETFYAGQKGASIQMRIYDKGKEIIKDNKQWFLPLWGREGPEGVWRVEFQLLRPALKEWGIESLENLTEKLGGLWRYLTTEWFSLRFPDNSKQERRTVIPWWKAVQEKPIGFGHLTEIVKPDKVNELASIEWYVSHIGGCLPSYAARRGAKNFDEAMTALQNDICLHWYEKKFQDELEKRILKLGNEIETNTEEEDYDEYGEYGQKMFLFEQRSYPLPFYV